MEKPAIIGGRPVRKNFLLPFKPAIGKEEMNAVLNVLRSGWITTGPRVHEFEEQAKAYLGSKQAIALSSCTAALHLALVVAGVGQGDEVITTPFTFISTVNVIVHQKATPVLVDIERDYYTIDPKKIERAITKKTKAIIAVHYAGQPAALAEIKKIAKKYKLFLIEDAAHAMGTEYQGEKIGKQSDAACFSFYAAKNLAMAEGGLLVFKNPALAKKARLYSLHGMSRDAWKRYSASGSWYYEVLVPGFKYNLTDIQAAMGLEQLKKLEGFFERKRAIAKLYNEAFGAIPELSIPKVRASSTHTYYLYPLLLNTKKLAINRDKFIDALKAENIGTSVHFIPVHLHPYYQKTFDFKKGDFPVTEWVFDRILSLPIHAAMTMNDANDVVRAVQKIIHYYKLNPTVSLRTERFSSNS